MSRFLNRRLAGFVSYTPGEQPRDRRYIKLNTNESPFPPAPQVAEAAAREAERCNLYCDPTCQELRKAAAEVFGVTPDMVLPVNGSDEILNFAFMTFCGEDSPLACPDITYGVYPILAKLHRIPLLEIPLRRDFTLDPEDYLHLDRNIVLPNPNAPTGLALPPDVIESIVAANPDHLVIIDEAYVDFGAESVVPLTKKYENLLVTRTFSKSHSLAGARLGFGIGAPALIADMELVKYATNPYNVNRMTQAVGAAALAENDYYLRNCRVVAENRDYTAQKLRELGFFVTDSKANFLFIRSDAVGGRELYDGLRQRGVLVRHFSAPAIADYNRVTVGSREQMDAFLAAAADILREGDSPRASTTDS